MYDEPAISESAMPDLFARLGPIFGRQITIELRPDNQRESLGRAAADFSVSVTWGAERYEFAAEAKMRSTPRALEEALRQARRWAVESGRAPMRRTSVPAGGGTVSEAARRAAIIWHLDAQLP